MESRLFREDSYTASGKGDRVPKLRKLAGPTDEQAIAKRLREARVRRGLMQTDLAAALGIDQSLISEYERGVVRVHGTLLAAFARELKVSADELLGLKRSRRNGDVEHDPRLARRLQLIRKLPKRDKQALLRSIDNFLRGAGVLSDRTDRRASNRAR
jgi:transcriptional regulator with XRE-family HTH domain